jgi:4'-phosphopantetheinyl transferase
LKISRDELHIWEASLDRTASAVASFGRTLSEDERARADRFRFERDRARYIVGRGLLRRLLGEYLGLASAEIRFAYGPNDKPRLERETLHFNLSHSGPIALYAFNRDTEVGVDIELGDADLSKELIAERFFSPSETASLRSLPQALQSQAFLACWTRKEAFIKARGDGLSLALDSFDVSLQPDTPAAVLRTEWCADEPGQWWLGDLSDPGRGYIAAVAVKRHGWRVIRRRVPDTIDGTRE